MVISRAEAIDVERARFAQPFTSKSRLARGTNFLSDQVSMQRAAQSVFVRAQAAHNLHTRPAWTIEGTSRKENT
eukprot:6212276-Pleurochrysis_carterae.AAC.2